ncbi:acyl-CoA dehydrogenase family protein [Lacrimispora algidixylanolytica]|uniref:Acyl-CoA dehydrogenase n=1 Tax=Lacrimispora algidixylanolytica TaxID=94868 RepID=A0A419T1M1_9FIRM|nr:acyl-CoA dehydrogenase family protein [Lacrimispora algidixylanolytica]RKD31352.1 acyl-CoA dehydrogenase [Lacrimispora algidixylanolytica]
MDFSMSQEQNMFKRETIDFIRNNLNLEEFYEKYSPEMWQKVAEFGLLGITIGEEYGGLNESYLTAAIIFEAFGYACKNNGFTFVINNHIWVSQNLIYLYGARFLKDKYLKLMVSGERIGAIAITEVEAGSDALSMHARAEKDDQGYVLNGNKMFISNGPIADIFIVFAVTEHSQPKKITAFVVEREFKGVKIGKEIGKMGLNACPTSEVIFNNCYIPKENVLGQYNQGELLLTYALEWERFYEFVPHIGVMQRIMEQCSEHVRTRKQFGIIIGDNQSLSHKIAEMKVAIEMSKQMMYKIAWLKDCGKTAFTETSIFKLYVSENYIKTCRDALQIFGAYGYTKEYDIERELRDALACSIYSGTNEMQKNTIYKMLSFI